MNSLPFVDEPSHAIGRAARPIMGARMPVQGGTSVAVSVQPVVLTDGAVTLRGFVESDLDEMVVTARDAQTRQWTPTPPEVDRAGARWWAEVAVPAGWRDGSAYRWAIEARDPDGRSRFAGWIEVLADGVPAVAFVLAPWARGRGIASGALRLAADWGFDVAGLAVLHWHAPAGHVASWRVAHACGFSFTGAGTLDVLTRDGLVDGWHAVLCPDPDMPVARRVPRTTWWSTTVLEGQRVRLRPYVESDVARVVEACSDEWSRYWSATLPDPFTERDAWATTRRADLDPSLGKALIWVIASADDDRLLGDVAVFGMDDPYSPNGAEVGYRAHPDARGRGVVTEAVRLAAAHAFTSTADGGLGRTHLRLGVAAGNEASRRVARRCGFRPAARFRRATVVGGVGRVDDGIWYDRLATDQMSRTRKAYGSTGVLGRWRPPVSWTVRDHPTHT